MSINLTTLGLYIAAVIAMIAVPGPVVLLVTGAGLAGGPLKALRTIVGTNAASLVLIAVSAFVIKGLLSVNESVFIGIKFLGCIYIGYVSLQILREPAPRTGQTTNDARGGRAGGFSKGFLMGISNPKDIIFFASFFPQFIDMTPNTNTSLAFLTMVWITLDFSTLMLVYMFISKVTKPTVHHKLMKAAGSLLLLIAIVGATTSLLSIKTRTSNGVKSVSTANKA